MSFNLSNHLATTIDTNNNHSDIVNGLTELPLLNVTRGLPVQYVVVLFGYITPVFFLITVVANIMIVLVLSRPDMRSPTNLVLLSMAVADLLTLIFPVPWYFYMYTLGEYRYFLHPALLCNLYAYMVDVLPAFFHTASIWCTLLLACQRYIYICHPSMARIWCTNKRVSKAIGAIFILALVHQLLRFFESHYEDVIIPNLSSDSTSTNPTTQRACQLVTSDWVARMEVIYFLTYFTFRIIFVHIGPCLALVIFNVLLYSALKRAEVTRNKLFVKHNIPIQPTGSSGNSPLLRNGNCRSMSFGSAEHHQHQQIRENNSNEIAASRRSICVEQYNQQLLQKRPHRKSTARGIGSGRDANSTTFMLIVVVTVFLIVEIPLAVTTAVHITENVFELDLVSDQFLNMTIIFSNFFIIISYPLNFAIYCDFDSVSSRQTSISSSPLNQRITNRLVDGETNGNHMAKVVTITDSNGSTQLANCNIVHNRRNTLCETML
ncbi:hypothetical protein RDWZM_000079 [Blomia tropicalis]|uniref:G-protein coupled receptors family 1 profile domain-containing protein n=1 Tax=Blomia tropicalis TaxID=40697 RepID=A0A9Q0M9R3_BLOTA|nr:hypothetical protein RDWZM_000079 [Blomia tropicalis]